MRTLYAIALLAVLPTAALADCPIGSHPWTDSWGNQIPAVRGRDDLNPGKPG